jgi:alkaline phosphatase D
MSAMRTWLDTAIDRRSVLLGAFALCGLPIIGGRPLSASSLRWADDPFGLGVASGDPSPDGMVLWTRLAPDPLNGGGMPPAPVEVTWEIASDERFSRVLRRGRTMAVPEWGHSVHVEVDGLPSDRWFWYRFRVAGAVSPVGRTRTLPAPGAHVDRLRFAFASCQHYETGLYTAYRHMVREDLDLVFFLGDYIYEGPGRDNQIRKHVGPEIMTIDHYRNRLAQYRSDPRLMAAHAAFPWVVTWDDHEVDNNYANDIQEAGMPREEFLLRRAAAYQAYYEHMPLRWTSVPKGPHMPLYRGFSYGDLASCFVLDTRQYRTDQPCNDGTKAVCAGTLDPNATLMGQAQERWLHDGLDRSRSRWNILPQQIMMARMNQATEGEARYSMDQWTGYEAERQRLLQFFATRKPSNPIVLTGDIHSSWVNDLQVNASDEKSPVVATEFVGTSITSGGDGSAMPDRIKTVMANNPFLKFYNGQRGYVSCEVSPTQMHARYQGLDYVSKPGAPLVTRATFVVEDGRPGAKKL